MKTAITVILIIVAVAAVLFFLPLIIMFFSYVFGIDMDEDGGLHECIGCPNESDYCTEECRIYKKYQKRLARMEEDKEQERYLQEYAKRKQEKKNRKEKISNCYLHSNSLSNKMDNSLLAVRDINHKYIVVERRASVETINTR